MAHSPKLSILIATIGQRQERFLELLEDLDDQMLDGVEVIAYWNNGELKLGEIRQTLVEAAKGDYICFVDDDDKLPTYYIREILQAIRTKPDYVGWQMQLYTNGEKMKPTFHSLKYNNWSEDDDGYYRDVSHLNPVKRKIAKQVSFITPKGNAEDVPWARQIRPLLSSEVYINKPMYFYRHSTEDSHWRGEGVSNQNYQRPTITKPYFLYCVKGE